MKTLPKHVAVRAHSKAHKSGNILNSQRSSIQQMHTKCTTNFGNLIFFLRRRRRSHSNTRGRLRRRLRAGLYIVQFSLLWVQFRFSFKHQNGCVGVCTQVCLLFQLVCIRFSSGLVQVLIQTRQDGCFGVCAQCACTLVQFAVGLVQVLIQTREDGCAQVCLYFS